MAKAKLITVDRPASVTRERVSEVITRNAQSGKFADNKSPKEIAKQTTTKKK